MTRITADLAAAFKIDKKLQESQFNSLFIDVHDVNAASEHKN